MRIPRITLGLAAAFGLMACETDAPVEPVGPAFEVSPAQQLDATPGDEVSILAAPGEFSSASLASISGKAIAYDMSHDTGRQDLTSPTGGNFNSIIFGDYTAAGATITVITTFDAATLSGFDVLWLEEDFSSFLSAAEKTDLANFVAAGGGLVICCEDWGFFTGDFGSPLKVFGMNYGGAGGSGTTTNIFAHPTTVGVTSIQFAGSDIGITFPATATALFDNPAGTSTHGVGLQSGIGRVVAISDEFCGNGVVTSADNRLFCNQMLDWVANPIIIVEIDIKPGSFPNSINLGAKGVLPVAILTTAVADGDPLDFDAATVNPTTVTLGNDDGMDTPVKAKKNGSLFASLEDVDGDGDLDLALKFDQPALEANGDLTTATTELILNGLTFGLQPIKGSDSVRLTPASFK